MIDRLDSFSFGMSFAGITFGAMAGMAAYSLAAQQQAFRVHFIAAVIIAALGEITLHTLSLYRQIPELGRFSLGVRGLIEGLAALNAYFGMTGILATNYVGIQNNFASQAAILSGFTVVHFCSHVYNYMTI